MISIMIRAGVVNYLLYVSVGLQTLCRCCFALLHSFIFVAGCQHLVASHGRVLMLEEATVVQQMINRLVSGISEELLEVVDCRIEMM